MLQLMHLAEKIKYFTFLSPLSSQPGYYFHLQYVSFVPTMSLTQPSNLGYSLYVPPLQYVSSHYIHPQCLCQRNLKPLVQCVISSLAGRLSAN